MSTIRKATAADLDSVEMIYNDAHDAIETGRITTGWIRGVYPTRDSAEASLKRDDLFVLEDGGEILGTGIINRIQVDVYEGAQLPADKKSMAFTVTFTPADKELTDADIDAKVEKILSALDAKYGISLRA